MTDAVKNAAQKHWKAFTNEDGVGGIREGTMRAEESVYSGTYSVFNIELAYFIVKRYAPKKAKILDAFAGGPPRGLAVAWVNSELEEKDKHTYFGYDVSVKQISHNHEVARDLNVSTHVRYQLEDARNISKYDRKYTFAMTCPPYFDLEVYSDQDNDISNAASYEEFNKAMFEIARQHKKVMKAGSFVVMIIGNVRNKKTGELYNLVGDAITNFKANGFMYWDDPVLSKPSGSAAIRAANSWSGKKLVRTHENVLIFKKPEKKGKKDATKRTSKRSKTGGAGSDKNKGKR